MMAEGESTICIACKKGHVTRRLEEMTFRQWSDKGYIRCRVTILMGTCDHCRTKSTEPGVDKIFDAAFKAEYDKLR
jgi:hypothetical protein